MLENAVNLKIYELVQLLTTEATKALFYNLLAIGEMYGYTQSAVRNSYDIYSQLVIIVQFFSVNNFS